MRKLITVIVFFLTDHAAFCQTAPNILWIYVDDMSDWLGCYGDNTVATPHIDQLAEGGGKIQSRLHAGAGVFGYPAPLRSLVRCKARMVIGIELWSRSHFRRNHDVATVIS